MLCKGPRILCKRKRDARNAIVYTQSKTAPAIFSACKCTNRGQLAAVALRDCQEIMAPRGPLLVYFMRRKYLKQF